MVSLYPVFPEGVSLHRQPSGGIVNKKDIIVKGTRVNSTATRVLGLCDGTQTVEQIVREVAGDEYGPEIDRGIKAFLNESVGKGHIKYLASPTPCPVRVTGSSQYFVPTSAVVEVTNECNLRCKHCYATEMRKNSHRVPVEQMMVVLKKLSDSGVGIMQLTGGEPFMHPDFFRLFDYCAGHFHFTTVSTNGTLITRDVARRLGRYAPLNASAVQISLDGSGPDTHDRLRGVDGAFDRTIEALKLLVEYHVPVSAAMSISDHNKHDVETTIKLLAGLGVKRFIPSKILPMGAASNGQWTMDVEGLKKITGDILALKEKYQKDIFVDLPRKLDPEPPKMKNCGIAYETCVISPEGNVKPCPMMPDGLFRIGNLIDQEIEEVFMSPLVDYFNQIESPKPVFCAGCASQVSCGGCISSALLNMDRAGGSGCKWSDHTGIRRLIDERRVKDAHVLRTT